MLFEILKRTPPWVFLLFFVLLALGYVQSKDRAVRSGSITILPAAMTGLSFFGVVSAFGMVPLALASWFAGVTLATVLAVKLATPQDIRFSPETRSFFVPGSWLPLVLMMAIFFTKYAVGVTLARRLPIALEPAFIGSISLCYGVLSGLFLARAIVIRKSKSRNLTAHAFPHSA